MAHPNPALAPNLAGAFSVWSAYHHKVNPNPREEKRISKQFRKHIKQSWEDVSKLNNGRAIKAMLRDAIRQVNAARTAASLVDVDDDDDDDDDGDNDFVDQNVVAAHPRNATANMDDSPDVSEEQMLAEIREFAAMQRLVQVESLAGDPAKFLRAIDQQRIEWLKCNIMLLGRHVGEQTRARERLVGKEWRRK